MLSETPATIAISRVAFDVCTSGTIKGANRLCNCRGTLSSLIFHNSFMSLTVVGLRIVSFFCHDVRAGSPPSVNQPALSAICARGATVHRVVAQRAQTIE